ncbi:hypothetical protein BGX28_004561 [Mortierella sp. GBA30]|nr:hypothetical protein BGX28_004561 [Mortierella sp. GBA30]
MPRAKYFHQLCPPPLDLPEIINNIRSHLSNADIMTCTLVCSIWRLRFSPFLWDLVHFNRLIGDRDPRLETNGHFIRHLVTYSLHDRAIYTIAKFCPNLTGIELELETLQDPSSILTLYSSTSELERLTIRLNKPNERGRVQHALLMPLMQGVLANLRELRLIGLYNKMYAPVYQTDMILCCMEGCPKLQLLELSAIHVIDTDYEWEEAIRNTFNTLAATPPRVSRIAPAVSSSSWLPSSWLSWRKVGNNPTMINPKPETFIEVDPIPSCQPLDAPTPDPDYKSDYMRTLKLNNVYSNVRLLTGVSFTTKLLQRCPNLAHLALTTTSADIERLAVLCPKLKTVSFQEYNNGYVRIATPQMDSYLCSSSGSLMFLRILRLIECHVEDQILQSIQNEFKRYRLQQLEIANCTGMTPLGLATFLGQCEALERVSIDKLLGFVPESLLVQREPSWASRPQGIHPRAIRWDCSQIRYLDVYGITSSYGLTWSYGMAWSYSIVASKPTFEHVLLDMVPRLTALEFLGMNTIHVSWLMELEPLQYAVPQASLLMNQAHDSSPEQGDPLLPSSSCEEDDPLPMTLFATVKTLSLESSPRRHRQAGNTQHPILTVEQAKYVYHAFPALEKIVYNCPVFPCSREAHDWFKKSPRQIEVLFRPKTAVLEMEL